MRYLFSAPSHIKAIVQLPASKSISNRALIIHAPSKGNDVLSNLLDCDDTEVMVKALTEGGEVIGILAAGMAIHFLTAHLSSTSGTRIIIGMGRIQQRPIQILVNASWELGVNIEYTRNEGFPPLRAEGAPLAGNEIILKGNVSSQYISALPMIGSILESDLQLQLTGEVVPYPYIDLTLQLVKDLGASARWMSD